MSARVISLRVAMTILLGWLTPAPAAAQTVVGYFDFTPSVLSASSPAQAVFTAEVLIPVTRVTFEFNPGGVGPTTLDARDDGVGCDPIAGDKIFCVFVPTAPIVAALRTDDVHRVFAGFFDMYNGATRSARLNVFADVHTPAVGVWPTRQLGPGVVATSRLVNIVLPAYFSTLSVADVSREFYRWLDDDYDFLNIIYAPGRQANRNHFAVRNDVDGIGVSRFNNTATYGSAGQLQGISQFPIPSFFDGAGAGYVHELGHQWINFLNAPPLASGIPHWPYSSMGGGVMGISIAGVGGTFACDVVDVGGQIRLNPRPNAPGFNPLDLYLMGLIPAADVGSQIVFDDQVAARSLSCQGQVFTGAVTRVSGLDVSALVGPRTPAAGSAPTHFRTATILVTRDGPASAEALSLYSWLADRAAGRVPVPTHEGLSKQVAQPFYVATGGRATLDVEVSLDPPEAPTAFRTTAISGNTVTFAWTPPGGPIAPTSYVIEGGVTPGSVMGALPVAGTPTAFTAVVPTGRFYVRLHAIAGPTRSAASNEIQIAVNVPIPPAAPSNLLGLVNGSSVALAWMNSAAAGAVAGMMLDVTGSIVTSLPLPAAELFTFNGVPPGTYTLSLRAVNDAGSSPPSNAVTLTFPGSCSGAPLTPAGFTASKSGNLVTVGWSLPASGPAPTSFVVSVTGAFNGAIPTAARTLSGVVGPGSYTISVSASNACGSSAAAGPITVIVP